MSKPLSELRTSLKIQRSQLDARTRDRHASRLTKILTREKLFLKSRHVAFYIPVNGEISTLGIMDVAMEMGKSVYLPVLMPFLTNRLWFAPYSHDCAMVFNRFGIPEPVYHGRHLMPASNLDIVLTPLVAFDPECNRIGMGGGYYDRTFSYLRHRQHWQKPKLIGVAYEFQKTSLIKTHKWDVPLHSIFTEENFYTPRNK